MKRIHKLEANISNKIAAGEVVERPAAVVKELVENAIDAGATQITVEVRKAGRTLIRVSDNGSGIDPSDVDLAFERHATSKIETVDDIYSVATLGFRGEALASISAVSNMDVITRRPDTDTGIKLSMSGGKRVSKEETGCPVGTTMIVKDLFFNTPARLKFLKSDNAERTALSDIVNKLALSHCEIGFRFIIDDKTLFSTPGKGDLYKSIYSIYEKEMSRNLIPIDKTEGNLRIKGFMSNLQYTRGNRSMQNFFVNGRYVKSSVLMDGVSMAYRAMLTPGRFPACFIMIELNPDKVDVNIHPAKTEIKFHQEGIVKQLLYTAVRETLFSYNQTPEVKLSGDDVFKKVVLDQPKKQASASVPNSDSLGSTDSSDSLNSEKWKDFKATRDSKHIEARVNSSADAEQNAVEALSNRSKQTLYTSTKKIDNPPPAKNVEGIRSHPVYEYTYDGNTNSQETPVSANRPDGEDKSQSLEEEAPTPKSASTLNARESTSAANVNHRPHKSGARQQKQAPISSGNTLNYDTLVNIPTEGLMREKSAPNQTAYMDSVHAQRMAHKSEIYEELRYIGQMFTTYLIFEKAGKMYLIDQHAAHEKILFERLLSQYRKSALDRQILLDPILIELSYDMHSSVLKQKDLFEKLGLYIEDFGGQSIVIREIPALLDRSGAEALFRKALDKFGTYNADTVEVVAQRLENIMQESCKTAIKAHDYMADIEVETLIDQLKGLDDPYTCPHGRPIIISISRSEIEKKFKRT
jgi:DNA mismatch repair protein MutL